jgi:hypothetical protein
MDPVFDQLQSEIARSLEVLTASQTQLRPAKAPHKWTIQQIVQHLCLTYSSTSVAIGNRLDKGRPTQAVPTIPQRCAQLLVTKFGFFPSGRDAPPAVEPPEASTSSELHMSGVALAGETARHLTQTDQVLGEAERRFGSARSVSHGVLGPLSIAQWRRFHLVHGRHHLKQIWAIRRDHGI